MDHKIDICQFLPWDSAFFGMNIARVTANQLREESLGPIIAWSQLHRIDCLYFLADSNDASTVYVAEKHGFHFSDVRVTLERRLRPNEPLDLPSSQAVIRNFRQSDLTSLCAIARTVYRGTRFYFDERFSDQHREQLYEIWLEQSCAEPSEVVLVAEFDNRPIGYITGQVFSNLTGQIGLIGVDERHRGKQIGLALVGASLRWFQQKRVSEVLVVTQGRNVQAQRLYQAYNFLVRSQELWYHKWFSLPGGA